MAQSAPRPGTTSPTGAGRDSPWAVGGTMFAGVLLLVEGVLAVFTGIAGIATGTVYARVGDYTFKYSVSGWGWIHLVLGVILILVGLGILRDVPGARVAGVGLAALSIVANFVWLPYQPVWAVVSIALDTFVIWALCTADRSKAPL
ncbi:DUF7144 family membrane protein [Streptomyces griseus]|uniref:DUF7144 family membrane protein n=1 Tax=Streptomyces griseus TaxID=1911 RepID=UPI00083FF53A|nr:hypothetical protein [Streptomyces griseus]